MGGCSEQARKRAERSSKGPPPAPPARRLDDGAVVPFVQGGRCQKGTREGGCGGCGVGARGSVARGPPRRLPAHRADRSALRPVPRASPAPWALAACLRWRRRPRRGGWADPSVLSCPGRLEAAGQVGSERGTRREALPGHFFWLGVLCNHPPYVRLSLGCERRAGGPVARGGKV